MYTVTSQGVMYVLLGTEIVSSPSNLGETKPLSITLKTTTMFQTGVLSSFINCAYNGDVSLDTIMQHGNTGLGTINGVDGNIIILNNVCYHIDSNGKISIPQKSTKTPFCVIAPLVETKVFYLEKILSFTHLSQEIKKQFPSNNYMYIMTINGHFDTIKMRSERSQQQPYRSLSKTIKETQNIFELVYTDGIIVATYFPEYMKHINLSDFHMHFINDDKTMGGHVYNLKSRQLKVVLSVISDIHLNTLVNNTYFKEQTFVGILDSDIKTVEKGE